MYREWETHQLGLRLRRAVLVHAHFVGGVGLTLALGEGVLVGDSSVVTHCGNDLKRVKEMDW